MVAKTLEKIGLSEKEAKVYLAALELGPATVQTIATRAHVARPTTYVILEELGKKGLMSMTDKPYRALFSAEPPQQLLKYLELQELELKDKRHEAEAILQDLDAVFALSGERPKVRFYDDIAGLESAADDLYRSLTNKDVIYYFSPIDDLEEFFPDTQQSQPQIRTDLGVWAHIIYTSARGALPNANSKKEKRVARFLPKAKFPFRSLITIVPGKRVQLTNFVGRRFGVLIEDAHIADTMKIVWELAWDATEKYQTKS